MPKRKTRDTDEDPDDDSQDASASEPDDEERSNTTKLSNSNQKKSTTRRRSNDGSYDAHDVLMGRGKRVSEWPGNIYFRQVIAKYRDDYARAARQHKVRIAECVIQEIHSKGGRFVKEAVDGDGQGWFEIEPDRAIEKACQGLREKEKCKTPTTDPFTDPNRKTLLSPYHDGSSPSKKKRRKKKKALFARVVGDEDDSDDDSEGDDDSDDDDTNSDDDLAGEFDADGKSPTAKDSKKSSKKKDVAVKPEPTWMQQIRSYDEHEMLKRLNQFKCKYGHCGVPPGWPRDTRLADWCSAMRQVHREVTTAGGDGISEAVANVTSSGATAHQPMTTTIQRYREATPAEDDLLKELDDMEFVWNYQDWHWKDRCAKLMAVQGIQPEDTSGHSQLDDDEPETDVPSGFINKALVRWLSHERQQVRQGWYTLTKEQMQDLRRAGIAL